MQARTSSRIYNQSALEVWFSSIEIDWEPHFSPDVLSRGQQIYREGKITEIELTEQEAIVHCSFSRKDNCYAVIDWVNKRPKVRASIEDNEIGRAVAVAGMYEIEELIADEIDPLPYAPQQKLSRDKRNDRHNNHQIQNTKQSRKPNYTETNRPADFGKPARPSRRLTPRLEGLEAGLRLTAYWVSSDFQREPAFQQGSTTLNSSERESIVRLTAQARNAGFHFRSEQSDFILADPKQIGPFFAHQLKRFEKRFDYIDIDPFAEKMAKGARPIKVVGKVKAVQGNAMKVDWQLKLGRKWLNAEDSKRLTEAGRGTHIVKGLGLVHIAEEQSKALAEWRTAAQTSDDGVLLWPRYMVFSLFGQHGAQLNLKEEMAQWRDGVSLASGEETAMRMQLPKFLRDYQREGVRWLSNLRVHACHGLLADEMGLGKTLQVLTLLAHDPIVSKPSLIVCPASVVPVWQSEAKRWYPNLRTQILRSGVDFTDPKVVTEQTLWIASYTQLRRHKNLLDSVEFGYAALDEAQQIKNPDAKVTHACCAIQAECRIALTGTPIENRLLDVWTIFRFLMPGLLGNRRSFEDAATHEAQDRRAEFEKRLRVQIAPFLLRRQKDTVGKDLPPKLEMDLVCPITDVQRSTYERLLDQGRNELGDDLQSAMQNQAMSFFSLLTRLRQVCCDPGLIPGVEAELAQSGKIQTLLIHLEEALQGNGSRKVVIFSQFVQLLKRLKPLIKESFPTVSQLELTGQSRDRQKPVELFQQIDGPAVILVSLRAGGTGITLHAADYVFLLDPWWNPAVESQAVDRVHRIGQDRRVFVYRMITQGTIEERIQQLKKEKRALFENTLGSIGSAGDLRTHFSDLEELAKLMPVKT